MKTAHDIYQDMIDIMPFDLSLQCRPYIIEAMKVYAEKVTQQALKDASENALMIDKGTPYFDNYSIDKESIVNTEIKTP